MPAVSVMRRTHSFGTPAVTNPVKGTHEWLSTPSPLVPLSAAGLGGAQLACHGHQRLIAVLGLWGRHALDSTNRPSPSFSLAEDLSVFHDEPATHQGMNRHTGDFHAFERCNLAARLELIRRDRI